MPPRFVYWTIVAGGLPTAFRATEREELLPTFHRIKEKHPDAEMKYFARGKLWASPEDAQREADARRATDRRPESRARDWRPGGEHRDPRQKFKDAKKDRNLKWRKQRFDRHQKPGATGGSEAPPRPAERPEWRGRPPGGAKPQGEWRDRPSGPPKPRGEWRDRPSGPPKPRGEWRDRPAGPPKPQGEWRDRPSGPPKPRDEWRGRPQPKGSVRPPKPGEGPKPASRPFKPPFRPAKPFRPSGPPGRGRPPRGPSKDRRRS